MNVLTKTGARRACVAALLLSMLAWTVPMNLEPVYAAAALNPPRVSGNLARWDCVYLGNYPQSDASGTRKDPIKWRVIKVNGNDACLISDTKLDVQQYHTRNTAVAFPDTSLKRWLNSTFINRAFTAAEQTAIYDDRNGKVHVLNQNEMMAAEFGFINNSTRMAKNTNYTVRLLQNSGVSAKEVNLSNGLYFGACWLRVPSDSTGKIQTVRGFGAFDSAYYVTNRSICVRPMLHMKIDSSCWRYAGKLTSAGATAPDKPTNFKAKRTSFNSASLSWNKVPEADGYEIYRAVGKTGEFIRKKDVTDEGASGWRDTALSLKQTYKYKIRAYWKSGNGKTYSGFSPIVSITVPNFAAPKVTGKRVKNKKIELKWKKVTGASGYRVYCYNSSKSKKNRYTKNTNIKFLGNLKKGKKYKFKVCAYRTINGKKVCGNWSKTIRR